MEFGLDGGQSGTRFRSHAIQPDGAASEGRREKHFHKSTA
jgi:hypothetical protein